MASPLVIILFSITMASFIFPIVFWSYVFITRNKQKKQPTKGTIFAKVDLLNRRFLIEKMETQNRLFFKNIHFNKWNKIAAFIRRYSPSVSKKILEIFNKLEKGSRKETLAFKAPSFHTKNRNVQYHLTFDKISGSTYYIVCLRYNHILPNRGVLEAFQIKEISKSQITQDPRLIKGFVAFNVRGNIDDAAIRFRELINFNRRASRAGYLKYNAILIIVVFANKAWQIKKMMNKIISFVQDASFSNELKHLYNGSAKAVSRKTNTIKNVNKIFQILNFLSIYSMKMNKNFISTSSDIDYEFFKTYNQALIVFDQALKEEKFEIKVLGIRNIETNKLIVNYYVPFIKNINDQLFNWITSDLSNKTKLENAFAEKILFRSVEKAAIIDVNDGWLHKNAEKVTNKKAVVIINFRNTNKQKPRLDLIKKIKAHKIPFALHIYQYNDSTASILKMAQPQLVLISDNVWTKSKLLSSDYFISLMSLNTLAKENKIRMIYKNPSLVLDKKIHSEIGLKYYF